MTESLNRVSLGEIAPNPEKPGSRMELSAALGIGAFNFNIAILDPDERLSQSHFHYHENQREMFYVIDGRCQVESHAESHVLEADDAIAFPAGEEGVHVVHNPFDEACKVAAIGWPADGRFPVHQLATTEEILAERHGDST